MTQIIIPAELNTFVTQVNEQKKKEIQDVLTQIFTGTENWEKQIESIEVNSISDLLQIQMADTARKNVKNARLAAEKIFDSKREAVQQIKAEFDLEDKMWLKAKQIMQLQFKAIEEKATWKAEFSKRYEAEQKEQKTQTRILQVSLYAEINRFEFENMSDESFESFLSGLKAKKEAEIEALRKAEQARIDAEKKREEERKALESENERLKKEAELKEAERRAELAKIEAERKQKEEIERIERERLQAIAKKEREEREKIEAQQRAELAKKQAEEKARLDAEKALQLAPDREKLLKLKSDFENIVLPILSTDEAKKAIANISELKNRLLNFIDLKISELK
jgi:hypothetical protein